MRLSRPGPRPPGSGAPGRTAREANEIIARIAKDRGAQKIVKSKSMTAEETFFNDHLERKA